MIWVPMVILHLFTECQKCWHFLTIVVTFWYVVCSRLPRGKCLIGHYFIIYAGDWAVFRLFRSQSSLITGCNYGTLYLYNNYTWYFVTTVTHYIGWSQGVVDRSMPFIYKPQVTLFCICKTQTHTHRGHFF